MWLGGRGDEEWPFMLPLCQFYFVVVAKGDEKFVDVSGGASAGQKLNKMLDILYLATWVYGIPT